MKKNLYIFVSVSLLLGSLWLAKAMINTQSTAEQSPSVTSPPLVEIVTLAAQSKPAIIRGTGTIIAAKQLTIYPQVSGIVLRQSPQLVLGGTVQSGDKLLQIDPRDYDLIIQERRSQVDKAKLDLELEQGRGKIASREWELLGKKAPEGELNGLALRKPHLVHAQAALESAKSKLKRAQLDKQRTTIKAPFNATITQEQVEKGQVITPNTPVATLVGTDQFWAKISIPMNSLHLLRFPTETNAADPPTSTVRVFQDFGHQQTSEHQGQLLRVIGELDAKTRMAQVLIAIDHPLDLSQQSRPLLPGAYVSVEIQGKPLDQVIPVPRQALIQGKFVWILDQEQKIRKKRVKIAWSDDHEVWVESGLEAGQQLVTSLVPAIEGMSVRIANTEPSVDQ